MNKRGFTLVEVIVVMAVLAIMLAISAPSLIDWRQNAKIKEVARDILSGLRQARSMAVTENQNIEVKINPVTYQLKFNDVVQKTFPDNIKLEVAEEAEALTSAAEKSTIFEPQGSCNKLLKVRVNEDPSLEIKIESKATGLARL